MAGSFAKPWQAGRGALAVLPALLFEDRRPWLAILAGWMLAFAGSSAIGLLLVWLVPDGAGPDMGDAPPMVQFVGIAVFSPVAETILMAGLIAVLRRVMPAWWAVIASAAAWGVAHSLAAPLWGIVIWWPFLIFSTLYVTWSARGFWAGVAVAASVHVLQNVAPAAAIALGY